VNKKSYLFKKSIFIIIFTFYSLSSLSCSLFVSTNNKTPVTDELDSIFIKKIGSNTNLNKGITIEYVGQIDNYPNMWYFFIFNHTEEQIIFPNYGYGMKIYCPDVINNEWDPIEMRPPWASIEIALAPKLETFDVAEPLTIDTNNLYPVCPLIRLLIIGKGEKTGQQFGAYIDIEKLP